MGRRCLATSRVEGSLPTVIHTTIRDSFGAEVEVRIFYIRVLGPTDACNFLLGIQETRPVQEATGPAIRKTARYAAGLAWKVHPICFGGFGQNSAGTEQSWSMSATPKCH